MRSLRGIGEDLGQAALLHRCAPRRGSRPVGDLAREGHLVGGEDHRHASEASSRDDVRTSATSSGSSALVISSSSSTRGCMASARAMAARCCCPPDRRSGYSSGLSSGRSGEQLPRALGRLGLGSPGPVGARVTFSITVMCGNRLKLWNTIPTSRRSPLTSTPGPGPVRRRARISPGSMASSALMHRSRVRLPASGWPDQAHHLVLLDGEIDTPCNTSCRRTTCDGGRFRERRSGGLLRVAGRAHSRSL